MPSCRDPVLLLLCLSAAAALQISAAPVALRAATSVQAEGVTLVQQETARCILAKWDDGEPARLRAKLDRRNIRGSRRMHDSLAGLSEIAAEAVTAIGIDPIAPPSDGRTTFTDECDAGYACATVISPAPPPTPEAALAARAATSAPATLLVHAASAPPRLTTASPAAGRGSILLSRTS